MSLQHLLAAIIDQTDREIAQTENAVAKRLAEKKAVSDKALSAHLSSIDEQVTKRKAMLRAKAETHANLSMRSELLTAKQQMIDEVFSAVMEKVSLLPDAEMEPVFRTLLASLPDGGEIRPSKKHAALVQKVAGGRKIGSPIESKGGFMFISEKEERNCTFEHLVGTELRSKQELMVARSLSA